MNDDLKTLTHDGVTIHVRARFGDADVHSFNGVVKDDEYRVRDLPKPILTCLDVGANIGCFAAKLNRREPFCQIQCIEADERNFDTLRTNVDTFALCRRLVVTYETGELVLRSTVFDGTTNTGGTTVIEPNEPDQPEYGVQPRRPISQHERVTVEDLMLRARWDTLDLLKLDCEGSEHSILPNLHKSEIGLILGEWHGWLQFKNSIRSYDPAQWKLDFLTQPGQEMGIFRLSQRYWHNLLRKR